MRSAKLGPGALPSTRRAVGQTLRYALLVGISGIVALPLIWAVLASLKPLDEVYAYPPTWSIGQPQWSNYLQAAAKLPLLRFAFNSTVITVCSVVGAVLTSSMAGYAFARLPWRGKRIWFLLLLASMMIPAQVLLIPRFLIFQSLGWVGTYKPLIVPAWLGGGAFNVLLFRQFFRSIPREVEEAALIDGASRWQNYLRIMLPMCKPAVIAAGLLSFVLHWQEFLDPLIYLSDFRTYPLSVGLRMYQSLAGVWGNLLMAAALIALLPVAVVFAAFHKHLAAGLRLTRSSPVRSPSARLVDAVQ
ncbi:MAG: carbohydrate ABC transporter permease [Planctomycetota bacterium]|jgi:ABC-type glycerol-3-phosphate transport system permease component